MKTISKEKGLTVKAAFNKVLKDHGLDSHEIYQFSLVHREGVAMAHDDCDGKICFDPLGNPVCVPKDTPC